MVTKQQVLEFVRELIAEVKDYDGVVEFDTTLEALALDSLDYVQAQIEAKKRYGVNLTSELFMSGQIKTVGEMCAYIVESQVAAAAVSGPAAANDEVETVPGTLLAQPGIDDAGAASRVDSSAADMERASL